MGVPARLDNRQVGAGAAFPGQLARRPITASAAPLPLSGWWDRRRSGLWKTTRTGTTRRRAGAAFPGLTSRLSSPGRRAATRRFDDETAMEQKQVQTFDAWSVLPAALGTLAMLVAAQVFDANASVVIALIGTAVYLAPVGRTGIRRPWLNYALLAIADAGIVVLRFGNLSESAQRPVFWLLTGVLIALALWYLWAVVASVTDIALGLRTASRVAEAGRRREADKVL
jgi:hypothetical protein